MLTEWYYPLLKTCGFPQTPSCLQNQCSLWLGLSRSFTSPLTPVPPLRPTHPSATNLSRVPKHATGFETAPLYVLPLYAFVLVFFCLNITFLEEMLSQLLNTVILFSTHIIPKRLLNCATSLHCTLPSQKFKDPPT